MVKAWSIVLGALLIVLWIVGLSSPDASGWLTWLDGVAGLFGIIMGLRFSERVPGSAAEASRGGGPLLLALCLYALWIIGLASGSVRWQAWWTFAFACAYLLLAVSARGRPPGVEAGRPEERLRRVG